MAEKSEFMENRMAMSRIHKGILLFAIAMALFSVGRLLLWFTYPQHFETLGGGMLLQAFANGLRFDGAVVARLFALPLLLMWLPLRWFDRRLWFDGFAWLLYLITLGLVLLLAGDIIYYEHVQRHVSYELLLLQNDLAFLVEFGLKAHPGALLGFVLFAVGLGWLWWRILRVPLAPAGYAPLKYIFLFFLLAVVGRGGVSGKVIEIIDAYGSGDAPYGNLSLNGAFTTIVFALNMEQVNHHFFPQEQAVAIVNGKEGLLDPAYPMLRRYAGEPNGRNVVFVLLESWNFDYVDSFAGKGYGVTPHFDALAEEGLRYTRFYAAGQRSIEGIQATLTGIPALKGLPRIDAGIGVSNISRLGSMARERGYSTLFIQSSARDSFKISGIAAATGFEHFYGMEDVPLRLSYPEPKSAIFGWDYDTLQLMKEKLDGLKPPFLAYAFTGTTHEPYPQLPPQFMVRPHGADDENGYLNALKYADWSLGQFMAAARKAPWFENTVFIFTADHANHFQQGSGLLQRFHTPFLIYAPKFYSGEERRVIGSQLDVMPTILDLLGLDGEFAAVGESLLRKEGRAEAFVTLGGQQIGLISSRAYLRHDLVRRIEGHGPEELLGSLEQRLLALDQLSYELLQANRWAR
jgi:phosphoglycerol transferase MdoB-like AlkP superfamily enzyme